MSEANKIKLESNLVDRQSNNSDAVITHLQQGGKMASGQKQTMSCDFLSLKTLAHTSSYPSPQTRTYFLSSATVERSLRIYRKWN